MRNVELTLEQAMRRQSEFSTKALSKRVKAKSSRAEDVAIRAARSYMDSWMVRFADALRNPTLEGVQEALRVGALEKADVLAVGDYFELQLAAAENRNCAIMYTNPLWGLSWAQAVEGGKELETEGIFLREVNQ